MLNLKKLLILFLILLFNFPAQAQELDKKQQRFLKKNCSEIKLDNKANILELKQLDKALLNNKIVLLGEFTHGAKEINLLKNGMIKYLHEQLGYNVLLFESGIGELMGIELARNEKSPEQLLSMGLTGPWRTQEYLELMQYLKETETLKTGGFDVQRSGLAFADYLKEVIELIEPGLGESALEVEKNYGDFVNFMRRNKFDGSMQIQKDKLANTYQTLHLKITKNKPQVNYKDIASLQLLLTLKTIENRLAYLNYYLQFKKDNDYTKRWAARDSIMASNILWFAEHIYPDEKLIITAHNFHISKYNEKELTLGEVLYEKYQDDLYAIGIFGGKGVLANNSREPEKLTPSTAPNDIKWFVNNSSAENTFISITQPSKKGGEWLHQEVIINDSFIDLYGGNKLIPGTSFDGLIFIKNISPPAYR